MSLFHTKQESDICPSYTTTTLHELNWPLLNQSQTECSRYNKLFFLFQGHQNFVHSIAISPSGNFLVSAGNDMSIRLWEKSDEILVLDEEKEMVCKCWKIKSTIPPSILYPLVSWRLINYSILLNIQFHSNLKIRLTLTQLLPAHVTSDPNLWFPIAYIFWLNCFIMM